MFRLESMVAAMVSITELETRYTLMAPPIRFLEEVMTPFMSLAKMIKTMIIVLRRLCTETVLGMQPMAQAMAVSQQGAVMTATILAMTVATILSKALANHRLRMLPALF